MQVFLNKTYNICLAEVETESEEQMLLKQIAQGDRAAFWQLWEQYQDYLYRRCLTWMGGDRMDAQEAYSRATLKAWDKLPKYAATITNPRAWLSRLTHNLCMDLHRERSRGAKGIESIEAIAAGEHEFLTSTLESPDAAILRRELGMVIRRAINTLPPRLRNPFILRCCQEKSYQEIAEQLALSHDNVRKCIQQAREILQKHLHKYFAGLDSSNLESESPTICDWETPIAVGCMVEQINYKVTATCLETLSHAWYRSFSPLGWR
jgi:RNA polymerase sigma factor (sigma-70 family)